MEGIKQLQRRYGLGALTAGLALGAVLRMSGWDAAGNGVMMGGLFGAINFLLMGRSVSRRLTADSPTRLPSSMASTIGRYLILGMPILAAVKLDTFSLAGTIVGIFLVQACILFDAAFTWIRDFKRSRA
ncbi:MAG: ATP synthase subunit I [Desulfobacterales bacterium]